MSDNKMHTLQSAQKEIFEKRDTKATSVTLVNIQFDCAKRVYELLSLDKIVTDYTLFINNKTNEPCATFTF